MSGIFNGKIVKDSSISRQKLDFEVSNLKKISVTGSITLSGDYLLLPIGDTEFFLLLQYQSPTLLYLYGSVVLNRTTVDVRRASIYGDTSLGKTFNGYTFEPGILSTLLIDDILNDASDTVNVWVGIDNKVWSVSIWARGNGQRIDMWYYDQES